MARFKVNSHFLTLSVFLTPTLGVSYYYYRNKEEKKENLEEELREKYKNNIRIARSRNSDFEAVFKKLKTGDTSHMDTLEALAKGGAKSISKSGGGGTPENPQQRTGTTEEAARRQIRAGHHPQ